MPLVSVPITALQNFEYVANVDKCTILYLLCAFSYLSSLRLSEDEKKRKRTGRTEFNGASSNGGQMWIDLVHVEEKGHYLYMRCKKAYHVQ